MDLRIRRVKKQVALPTRATEGSAGYDLCAAIASPLCIGGGSVVLVPTGIAMEIPVGYVGLVFIRSGISSKYGVSLANSVGVIDSDFRGEIMLPLTCVRADGYTIKPLERLAQLVVVPFVTPNIVEVDSLTATARGKGGFGSTG